MSQDSGTHFDPPSIEEKWLKFWTEQPGLTKPIPTREKLYLLFAFAYPSGSGLHVGHVESKTALDILARFQRMNGYDVFFPVGWDAFGLPAENYAIKTGVPPVETTRQAIDTFRRQIKRLAISYDWENEIATCHPGYYRWTQWLFLQLYQKGLAYHANGAVNWCPSCQTVLANEQVVNGHCERCGSEVIQKQMTQWFFKITQYQDELIDGLNDVDWPSSTKQHQLDWIGRAKGLAIDFRLEGLEAPLTVWTKFWETVFGTTFVVIAPEKFEELGLIERAPKARHAAIQKYLEAAHRKTEEERKIGEKEKSGVDTGLTLKNPVNGEEVPLYVADYVLMGVGTAVVMGVPAHDERDFAFAKKYDLPIRQVVSYPGQEELNDKVAKGEVSHEGEGLLVNSGEFDGQSAWGEGKTAMAEWMIAQGFASWQTTYKLRDWLISRQRYWGAPIPIVYDPEGNPHPVKDEHLPWVLPTDVDFKPFGESPLKGSKEFQERTEKLYGKGWRPEYDTMDTFVDSSWYFMRYVSARDESQFADAGKLKTMLPVDLYLIGPEHIVLHLLYARFFTKFLRDEGHLEVSEPFAKMRHQGMILGPDGKKMSKSKGNVINPDDVTEKFGADTLRVYEMFMGPLEADKPWSTTGVTGTYRFLKRLHSIVMKAQGLGEVGSASEQARAAQQPSEADLKRLRQKLHQTIQKVSTDIPQLKFNTAVAALMEFLNVWESVGAAALTPAEQSLVTQILAPFAPFMAAELYQVIQEKSGAAEVSSVHQQAWPKFDAQLARPDSITVAIQINGKVRGQVELDHDHVGDQDFVQEQALSQPGIQKWLKDASIKKAIYIPGRILNLVVG
jgi:leucyl-tRNA synthetase